MAKRQLCPKCRRGMTQEEVGGRQFWQCESEACGGRVLLDKPLIPSGYVPPDPDSAVSPALPDQTPMPGPTKRRGMSAEARAKIGAAVAARHALKRAAKGLPPKPAPDSTPTKAGKTPRAIPPAAVHLARPAGVQILAAPALAPGLTALEEALQQLEREEHALKAQLDRNHEQQGALRKAATILRDVA